MSDTRQWQCFIRAMMEDISRTDHVPMEAFRGYTEAEIDDWMRSQDISRLPELYRQFLLQMGASPHLKTSEVNWALSDAYVPDGYPNVVVFATDLQGDVFLHFKLGAGDNPPVYEQVFGEDVTERQVEETLSLFFVGFFASDDNL